MDSVSPRLPTNNLLKVLAFSMELYLQLSGWKPRWNLTRPNQPLTVPGPPSVSIDSANENRRSRS